VFDIIIPIRCFNVVKDSKYKWDENIRISQLTLGKADLIDFLLKQEKYNFRYNGCNFVIGNLKRTRTEDFKKFEKQVLPYMKKQIKNKRGY
jgi:hypothetical protein